MYNYIMSEKCTYCDTKIPIHELVCHYLFEHKRHITPNYREKMCMIMHYEKYNFIKFYFIKDNVRYDYDDFSNYNINDAIFSNEGCVQINYNEEQHFIDLKILTMRIIDEETATCFCCNEENIYNLYFEHKNISYQYVKNRIIFDNYMIRTEYLKQLKKNTVDITINSEKFPLLLLPTSP